MARADLLVDELERIRDLIYPAVNGLSVEQLAFRPDGESNSIAWLAWHLTRVQDQVVSVLSTREEVWTQEGWFGVFALPLEPQDTGFGHGPTTVGLVTPPAALLLDYFEAVHQRTVSWVRALDDTRLAAVLDDQDVPPVTVEGKLVGVIIDDLQHVGQAAYVRGLVQRRDEAELPLGP